MVRSLFSRRRPCAMALGGRQRGAWAGEVVPLWPGGLAVLASTGTLAPVADANSNPDNRVIAERSFGDDLELVPKLLAAPDAGLTWPRAWPAA